MERLRITTPPLPPPSNSPPYEAVEGEIYVSWEAIRVSRENGRREINYYVKRKDGRLDLAVIGKEKSLRHMVYKNVLLKRPDFKLKTRREVVDWLNSIVSVSDSLPHESSQLGSYNVDDPSDMDIEGFMDLQSENLDCLGREFMWLGSPWKCRKQRKHYQSFHRNGVKISVNDFVYILAEENKQLVAYLEDMYEDCKGNKMAVVRWFHKADEVGFDLSHKFNDREIFFSLCHQDLNIECIDGLATVLSPQHLEKFNDKAIYYKWDPLVCYKQFEDDEVRLFDITRVKGYWKQEIFNSTSSVSKDSDLKVDAGICEAPLGPKKRIRLSKDHECIQNTEPCGVEASNLQSRLIECKSMTSTGHPGVKSSALLPTTVAKQNPFQYFQVGSEVEVLSQDSGIRGCWFRAAIIKKHKNKVKIRYQDLKDAADEAKHLEEWVISSKIALPDGLGVRICGRTTIRPSLEFSKDGVSSFDVGAVVDVWWHDGWWEGIVIKIESEDTIHVYFPGENNTSIFDRANLRCSQEWLGHRWIHIKDRPDIATSKIIVAKLSDVKSAHVANIDNTGLTEAKAGSSDLSLDYKSGDSKKSPERQDLLKDFCLAQWKSKRKRSVCVVRSGQNDHCRNHNSESSPKPLGYDECERFPISTTLKVDMDNCKCVGDFTSAVVQSMTNLVMSR